MIGWFAAPSGLRDTLAELGVPVSAASSFSEAVTLENVADTALPERESAGVFWYLGVVGIALVVGFAGALGVRRLAG